MFDTTTTLWPNSLPFRPNLIMPTRSPNLDSLETVLRPETALELSLLSLPDVRQGLLWGEPRYGHPEGRVLWHVREVLDNIDKVPLLSPKEREQLRLVAFIHDTFKYKEDRSRPRDWTKHHGRIARQFMEPLTADQVVLDLTELHDDAYYAWLNVRYEKEQVAEGNSRSLEGLLMRVSHCLHLYYIFFKCDTMTGDKTQAPLRWFEQSVPGIHLFDL
jgi:hypothetical protein